MSQGIPKGTVLPHPTYRGNHYGNDILLGKSILTRDQTTLVDTIIELVTQNLDTKADAKAD